MVLVGWLVGWLVLVVMLSFLLFMPLYYFMLTCVLHHSISYFESKDLRFQKASFNK